MIEMRIRSIIFPGIAVLVPLGASSGVRASSYQIVNSNIGEITTSTLTADSSGNIYGTGSVPGINNNYEVYQLSASSGYGETHVLYTFTPEGAFGSYPAPVAATGGVVFGSVYGGGANNDGVVVSLGAPSKPTATLLHSFGSATTKPKDGVGPNSGLTKGLFDAFYGTTGAGGGANHGVVFGISAPLAAKQQYTILHEFIVPSDGMTPTGGMLAVDSQHRLYGLTEDGGSNKSGTVFMLQYESGAWHEQVIYDFPPSDGLTNPVYAANVVLDNAGELYACAPGGAYSKGAIFSLTPPGTTGAPWVEKTIVNFGMQTAGPQEIAPYGCGLAIDPASRTIVGTTYKGGPNYGSIFMVTPPAAGKTAWTLKLVHSFHGPKTNDGAGPRYAPLRIGNTYYGSNSYSAAIYAFTP